MNGFTETDLGNVSFNPCGEYSAEKTYEYLDTVAMYGGSYLCVAETAKGISPVENTTTETWQCVAERGQDGTDGLPGRDGTDGIDGTDGKSAYQSAVEGGFQGTEEDFKNELANTVSKTEFTNALAGKADKAEIPTALPTPNKLTITGAVTGEFNGSQPLNIYIPEKIHPELVIDFTLEQDVKTLELSNCLDGELLADKNTSRIYFEIIVSPIASAENLQDLYVSFNGLTGAYNTFITIPQMLWNRERRGYVLAESAGGAFVCNYQHSGDKNNMEIFKDNENLNKVFTKISSIKMWNGIFSIPSGTNIKVWRLN